MNIAEWLQATTLELETAGIGTARLDALVLLEDQLHSNRAQLLAHQDQELTAHDKNVLSVKIKQRAKHVPLAYVRRKTEFYGRDFIITPAVLEPRPESEAMIDLLIKLVANDQKTPSLPKKVTQSARPKNSLTELSETANSSPTAPTTVPVLHSPLRIADVGTGSGAIGITAKLELPNVSIDLLEIDTEALQVARANVVAQTIDIPLISSDLLSNSPKDYDILLCNLPYVPDNFPINTAATHEPKLAIFGGPDGLDVYRQLFKQLQDIQYLQHRPLYILTESFPTQHALLSKIASEASYQPQYAIDFIQVYTNVALIDY
jgi:release factor glutamine methyltransferase